MRKLTKKQKIELLKKAIEILPSNGYICFSISEASNKKINDDDVFDVIPELLKYKPKKVYQICKICNDSWFKYSKENTAKRIEILQKTIKDLQN